LFVITVSVSSQDTGWKIAGEKITTQWAEKVNPVNPLPEYPRPQLVRSDWKSLNGLWDYAITPSGESIPKSFQGKILVPFAVESALSGVGKRSDPIIYYGTEQNSLFRQSLRKKIFCCISVQ